MSRRRVTHRPAHRASLAVVAAFRMPLQVQRANHRLDGSGSIAQVDQAGSFGTVRAMPGFCANASNQAVSFGCPSRQGCAAKRKSR